MKRLTPNWNFRPRAATNRRGNGGDDDHGGCQCFGCLLIQRAKKQKMDRLARRAERGVPLFDRWERNPD